MNIQPINKSTDSNVNFKKLIVKKGCFEKLKASQYFPQENYPNYSENLKEFYRKLMGLKKQCDKNSLYNVVIKSEHNSINSSGRIVIESAETGTEQCGFKTTFEELLFIHSMVPRPLLTKEKEPNLVKRIIGNWQIKQQNKEIQHKHLDMKDFLDIVYKRIEVIAKNADCLTEWHDLKQLKNVN